MITNSNNKEWLLSQLKWKVANVTLLYRGSSHGWSSKNFHECCDYESPTITIMKSKAAKIFGGFTYKCWDCKSRYKEDKDAFIFSIDRKKIQRVQSAKYSIYCHEDYGPSFGKRELILNNPLNKEDNGGCWTGWYEKEGGCVYGTINESEGNNEITGEGHKQSNN